MPDNSEGRGIPTGNEDSRPGGDTFITENTKEFKQPTPPNIADEDEKAKRVQTESKVHDDLVAVLQRMGMVEFGIRIEGDDLKGLSDKVWTLVDVACTEVNAVMRKRRIGDKLMTAEEILKTRPKR